MSEVPLAAHTSVIIVAYNSGTWLRGCILSILRTEPQVEIVVVDNASTDKASEQIGVEFPAIKVLKSEHNLGFGAGNNLGTMHTERPYLVFLNHDAIVTEGWVEALVRPLANDPTVGLVTPKILLEGEPERINVAGLDVHLSGISTCRGFRESRTACDQATEVAAISGATFAVRREVFQAIGGFNGEFFLYLEDVDISVRTWLSGYRCLYVPASVVYHRYVPRFGADKYYYLERNRYLMLLYNYSRHTLALLLPTLLLSEIVTGGYAVTQGLDHVKAKLCVYGWLASHWQEVIQARRAIRGHRSCADREMLKRCSYHLDYQSVSDGLAARVARVIFDPLFYVSRRVCLAAIR